uniref:Uncharacterized protein n=1 Tax=Panagrolaimus sp. ES5 TaxID=591445 RepID=A0AC34F5U5_9BILA
MFYQTLLLTCFIIFSVIDASDLTVDEIRGNEVKDIFDGCFEPSICQWVWTLFYTTLDVKIHVSENGSTDEITFGK